MTTNPNQDSDAGNEDNGAGDDPPLERRRPLSQHPELAHLQGFIDAFDAALSDGAAGSESPHAGETFGRFTLQRELGSGGFGTVFLAFDPVLGRQVALKLPRLEVWQSRELHDRFLREGQAAAGLDHPNILPVYDSGEVLGLGYIVSAYCSGPTLDQWTKELKSPCAREVAARLIMFLAKGVHHAHERGVLHRDIKPSNVLLEPTTEPHCDPPFVPRLTDFGLAKQLNGSTVDTGPGIQAGTPRYMAPEQLAGGEKRDIGSFTDVYALGVVLYELLAGKPPFDDANPFALARSIQEDEPPSIRAVRRDVSRDLETICLKCLEKDKSRRYAFARDLADDLQRFLDGDMVVARPIGTVERAVRWCRRRPYAATTTALLAASLLIGAIAVLWQWRRAELYAAAVEQSLVQAEQGLVNMSWIAEEKTLWSGNADPFFSGHSDQLLRHYERMLARPAPLRPSRAYLATIQSFRARAAELANRPDEAGQYFEQTIASWTELVRLEPTTSDYRRALVANLFSYGAHLRRYEQMDHPLAQPYEQAALYKYLLEIEPARGSVVADFAAYLVERGKALIRLGEDRNAYQQFRLANGLLVDALATFPGDKQFEWRIGKAAFYLACSHRRAGRNGDAIEHFTNGNIVFMDALDRGRADAECLFYRSEASRLQAASMRDLGETEKAVTMFETALHFQSRLKELEGESPRVLNLLASTTRNLAELYEKQGKREHSVLNWERFCEHTGKAVLQRTAAAGYAEKLPKVLLDLARSDIASGQERAGIERLIFACRVLAYIDPQRDAHAEQRLVWAECLALRAEIAQRAGNVDEARMHHRAAVDVLTIANQSESDQQRLEKQAEHHRTAMARLEASAS